MMDSIKLEEYSAEDSLALAGMNRILIEDEQSGNEMSVPELAERFREFFQAGYRAFYITQADDGAVVGYLLADCSGEAVWLRHVLVLRSMRRRHIGGQALRMLAALVGEREITLQVLHWNEPGRKFFESLGFVKDMDTSKKSDGKHIWYTNRQIETWEQFMPEFLLIRDEKLRLQIMETFDEAKSLSGHSFALLARLPFTVHIPGITITLREHMRYVAAMANETYHMFERYYGATNPQYQLNYNHLIAGALLHDVGKILEYSEDEQGKPYINERGKKEHHAVSGAKLAREHGIPEEIVHIIEVHVQDGKRKYRSPEAAIVNKIDLLNFDPFKGFAGLEQNY